jgi:hypothetical protein
MILDAGRGCGPFVAFSFLYSKKTLILVRRKDTSQLSDNGRKLPGYPGRELFIKN